MTKRFSLLLLSVCSIVNVSAQGNRAVLKKANKEFESFRYAFAIPNYTKYINNKGQDASAIFKLATSYLKMNQLDSAAIYFEKAFLRGAKIDNQLAELYATKGRYEEATVQYQKIKALEQSLLVDARLFGFTHLDQFYMDSLDYKLKSLPLNSRFNDFAAIPYKDGLVFVSNREAHLSSKKNRNMIAGWDGKQYTQLYFNNRKDSSSQKFSSVFNNKLNAGSISFTADYKQAYFTKNALKKGKKGIYQLEIWSSKWVSGKWDKANRLFFNQPDFSYFHPAITPDGKRLYFVSDDTTGYGGTDIYFVDQNADGSWKNTQNAGQVINTAANELFPSFYDGTLFFSSNGHAGMGGLDIYRIAKNNKGELEVKNLGYPVNSSNDDLTFSINGANGYFSSNRTGDDEVYAFEFNKQMVDLTGSIILDSFSKIKPVVYLTQVDVDGVSKIVDSAVVDDQGKYQFKARPNRAHQLVIKDAYAVTHKIDINTNGFQTNAADVYAKQVEPIQLKLPEEILLARKHTADSIKANDLAVMPRQFKRAIDSLATMSSDYTVLHHPFNQVYILKEDLNDYYKLIERVKKMSGKKIVIVSAADCTGDEAYNDDLSRRRANRIFKTLSKLGDHLVEIKAVGEMELIQSCDGTTQAANRYSYVYILDK